MKCPHECSSMNYYFQDCLTEPGSQPGEGDIGVCYTCGGWWKIVGGLVAKYTPMQEELELAMPQMSQSKERFSEWKRRPR